MYLNTVFKYNVFKYCPTLPGIDAKLEGVKPFYLSHINKSS